MLSCSCTALARTQAAVARGTLFVKRRMGALPYALDAVGARSLLSRAFHAPAAPSLEDQHAAGRYACIPVTLRHATRVVHCIMIAESLMIG